MNKLKKEAIDHLVLYYLKGYSWAFTWRAINKVISVCYSVFYAIKFSSFLCQKKYVFCMQDEPQSKSFWAGQAQSASISKNLEKVEI